MAIVEIYRIQPNFNILGWYTLTRRMILQVSHLIQRVARFEIDFFFHFQVFESALTILVVLYQYKAKGRGTEFKDKNTPKI